MDRRDLLRAAAASAALAALARIGPARAADLNLGPSEPFDWDGLVERARQVAAEPYVEPYRPVPEITERIDYEAHGQLNFDRDYALFADGPGVYPVTFFALGQRFPKKVTMHVLRDGEAREILYSPAYFEMPADSPARELPEDAGFAGFRLHEEQTRADWRTQDWVAFLGAAYFRSIGALNQYGLSARGVAVDVAAPTPEEFPDFTHFWIEPAVAVGEPVTVYALMDGPGITGAFRFAIRRTSGAVMDIDTAMFTRRAIHRLGIAPLTSMFWFAEYNRPELFDWRPEVHDSDGLALWTGAGERIWRPLNNPEGVVVSAFGDTDPRGFGLVQRDREFEHYLDGVNYDRRPSLWVEPLGAWGAGAIQLVEIPTDDEIHDNIVVFWVPEAPAEAGQELRFAYRLHWLADEPYPADNIAHTFATRIGRGGEPGKPRPEGVIKFVVEFGGGPLLDLPVDVEPDARITASRGKLSYVFAEPIAETGRWRAQFDLTLDDAEPVELRLYLADGERPLTETWLYQFRPTPS